MPTSTAESQETESSLLEAPSTPRSGRIRGRGILAIVIAGCLVVAGAAWFAAARTAVAGVSAAFDAQPITCDGTEVRLGDPAADAQVDDGLGFVRPIVTFAPGMTCQIRLHLHNGGWSDVSIDTVELPMLGAQSALQIVPIGVNPNGQVVVRPSDSTDASVHMSVPLGIGAGQDLELLVRLEYAGGAMFQQCSGAALNPPTVRVSALGASGDATPAATDVIWFWMGDSAACAQPPADAGSAP